MVILIHVFIKVNNRIQPYPFINPFEINGRLFMKSQPYSHQDLARYVRHRSTSRQSLLHNSAQTCIVPFCRLHMVKLRRDYEKFQERANEDILATITEARQTA